MKKTLLSALAFWGSMHMALAADPVDVTANFMQNYTAPFATTGETLLGDNTRWQILAEPWVTENNLGTPGVDYTAWHVDFQKVPNYPTVDGSRSGGTNTNSRLGRFCRHILQHESVSGSNSSSR